ncbi:MMPL family transporter [Streptomyces sp. XY332]|uniref:MMPL family transporter n=1 Tax=Streptomyces sp. XY332 TaxID=1415561 RepID=UPI00099C9FEE|nr:MMPL family transporter [Streptomyces sp. XY332]
MPVRSEDGTGRGAWSASRAWRVVVCAAVALVTALLSLPAVSGAFGAGGTIATGTESTRAQTQAEVLGVGTPDLVLAVTVRDGSARPAVAAGAGVVARVLAGEPAVRTVQSAATGDPWLMSRDGRTGVVTVSLSGSDADRKEAASRLVPKARAAVPGMRVDASGVSWATAEIDQQGGADLLKAELWAAPLIVLLLLLTYGSWAAAALPLVVAMPAVVCCVPLLGLLAQVSDVSAFAVNAAAAIGFGLSIDFTLFVLARYREEHVKGMPRARALDVALNTSGRCVFCSAVVISSCLAALAAIPVPLLRALALAGVAVTLLAALAALTVLPAALTLLGDRVDGADPLRRLRRAPIGGASRFWRDLTRRVTAQPVAVGLGALAVLAVMAWPATGLRLGAIDERTLPPTASAAAAAADLRGRFEVPPERVQVVVLERPGAGLGNYTAAVARLPHVGAVRVVPHPAAGRPGQAAQEQRPAVVLVAATVGPDTPQAARLVDELRKTPAPGPVLVGGRAAQITDTTDAVRGALPWVAVAMCVVLLAALTAFTRSAMAPLKALAVALISLAAVLGLIVGTFQYGHGLDVLGEFTVTGSLDASLLLFTLAVAFGLSIDYEVFLLGRIREEFDRGLDNQSAIVKGISRTGRLMTSAAAALAISTAAITTSHVTILKLMGAGIASAAVVDAILVRGVLVPAVMTLLGPANWWKPPGASRQRRVPQSATSEAAAG